LTRGEAFFDVKPHPDLPFVVDARHSHTRVLGTRFIVREEIAGDRISVISGLVEVNDKQGRVVHLRQNDSVTFGPKHGVEVLQVNPVNASAWLTGGATFDNATLAEVVSEIGRYRRGSILIKNEALRNLKVSGRFIIADTDKALDALQQTLPITIYRFTPWLVIIG